MLDQVAGFTPHLKSGRLNGWLRTDRVQRYGSRGEVANLIDLMGGWCFTGLQDFVN